MTVKTRDNVAEGAGMTTEERLARLERSLKWSRWTILALCISTAGLAGGLGYLKFATWSVIRAERIEVVNGKGPVIVLDRSDTDDGLITLHSSKGNDRVKIGASPKGYGMAVFYTGDDKKTVLVGGTGAGGRIAVFNMQEKSVVDLQADKSNHGAVSVHDVDGAPVQAMGTSGRVYR